MVTSGFFNSVNGDRTYSAEQMSAIFNGIINDGVFINVGTAFEVKADVGNQVTVGIGRAWIDGTWIYNDTILLVELEESDILADRIDAVVLETDHSAPVRMGSIKVVKGVSQTNPVRPTLEHSFYVNQYPLAYILRPKNSTAITQSNITYMVGTSETPFVTGILETLDIDALVAQWGAEWKEWFNGIKDKTSGDIIEYQEAWDQWFGDIKDKTTGDITDYRDAWDAWFQEARDELSEDAAGNLKLRIDDTREREIEIYGTISAKGWYQIAYIDNDIFSINNNSCIIDMRTGWNSVPSEFKRLYFINVSNKNRFVTLVSYGDSNLFNKIRLTDDGLRHYLEVYYDGMEELKTVSFVISNHLRFLNVSSEGISEMKNAWTAVNSPLSDNDVVNVGADAIATYNIAQNISGDTAGMNFLGSTDQHTDWNVDNMHGEEWAGGYAIGGSDPNLGGTHPFNRSYFLYVVPWAMSIVQFAIDVPDGHIAYRVFNGGKWSAWTIFGTGYLPLTGGTITGNVHFANSVAAIFDSISNLHAARTYVSNSTGQYILQCSKKENASDAYSFETILRASTTAVTVEKDFYPNARLYMNNNWLYMNNGNSIVFANGDKSSRFFMSSNGLLNWRIGNANIMSLAQGGLLTVASSMAITNVGALSKENEVTVFRLLDPAEPSVMWRHYIAPRSGPGYSSYQLRYNGYPKTQVVYDITWNGIGDASNAWQFYVYGSFAAPGFTSDSSRLIKTNIRDIGCDIIDKILSLRPVTFDFIEEYGGNIDQIGLIAEEVADVFPTVVTIPEKIDVKNHKVPSIDYSKLVTPLIKMVQVQQGEIDKQKRMIQDLENRVSRLESLLEKCIGPSKFNNEE